MPDIIQKPAAKLAFADFAEYLRGVLANMAHIDAVSLAIGDEGYASLWLTTDVIRKRDGKAVQIGCTLIPAEYEAGNPDEIAGFFVAYVLANINEGLRLSADPLVAAYAAP